MTVTAGGTAGAPFPAPARVARDLRRAGRHYSAFVHSRLTLSNRISSSSTALTTLEYCSTSLGFSSCIRRVSSFFYLTQFALHRCSRQTGSTCTGSMSTTSIHDIQRCCALLCAPWPDTSDGMQDEPGYAAVSRSLDRLRPLAQPSAEQPCKAISCTPRFATGVNLPVRLVVVKDIYPMRFIRRRPCRVMLSTGDLLNMLGRAGYPRRELEERPVHREGMSCLRRDQQSRAWRKAWS